MAATSIENLLINVQSKLDDLPLSFDTTQTNTDKTITDSISDTLREMEISISDVESGSKLELYLEIRILWWTLFRYKNSSAVFFKYSTGTNEGKSVDKTAVSKAIAGIMDDLDQMYQMYKPNITGTSGGVFNMTRKSSNTLG